jgi:hypothetical protein
VLLAGDRYRAVWSSWYPAKSAEEPRTGLANPAPKGEPPASAISAGEPSGSRLISPGGPEAALPVPAKEAIFSSETSASALPSTGEPEVATSQRETVSLREADQTVKAIATAQPRVTSGAAAVLISNVPAGSPVAASRPARVSTASQRRSVRRKSRHRKPDQKTKVTQSLSP